MSLQRLFHSFRAHWVLILLFGIIGAIGSLALSVLVPKTYTSTSTLVLRWTGPDSGIGDNLHSRYAESRAETYRLLADQPNVAAATINALGLSTTPEELTKRILVHNPPVSPLLIIEATDQSPELAQKISSETARQVAAAIKTRESLNPEKSQNIEAVVAVDATLPKKASGPNRYAYLLIGGFTGLILALGVALRHSGSLPPSDLRHFHYSRPMVRPGPMWGLPRATFSPTHLIWAMLIAITIPWRKHVLFEGGSDPVVVAKAIIGAVALVISWLLYLRHDGKKYFAPAAPIILIGAYLFVSVVGGSANNALIASAILAIRVAMIMLTIYFMVARYGLEDSTRNLVHLFTVISIVSAISGLPYYSTRLTGMIPPLNPNALAFMATVVSIWIIAKALSGRESIPEWGCLNIMLVIIVLTGSRTGIITFLLAIAVMLVRITGFHKRTLIAAAMVIPIIMIISFTTGIFWSIFHRGGDQQVATLSNRTIAWNAAVRLERDIWQTWFGQGLVQKKIPVPGQFWSIQFLDSTWLSALVQAGILGLIIVSLVSALTLFKAVLAPRAVGSLWAGLAVYMVFRATLESGLFDSSTSFLVFCLTAFSAFTPRRTLTDKGKEHPASEPYSAPARPKELLPG